DIRGELDRFLDRLLGLARKSENESTVDRDAELVAILREAARNVDPHALLDVVEDLLVAGFVADEQEAQTIIAEHFQRRARHVGFRVARPNHSQLAELLRDRLGARPIVGEGIVIEEELLDLWEIMPRQPDLLDDMPDTAHAVPVPADGLRPQAERAFRSAAAAGIER